MKRLNGAQKSVLALLLTAAIMAAAAFTPAALFRLEDQALLADAHPRDALGSEMSASSYLAWLLHTRQESEESGLQDEGTARSYTDNEAMERIYQLIPELAEASVVPYEVVEPPLGEFSIVEQRTLTMQSDSFGFESINGYVELGEGYVSLSCVVESRTAKIVQLSLNSDNPNAYSWDNTGMDINEALQNYINWLGLGGMEWTYSEGQSISVAEEPEMAAVAAVTAYALCEDAGLFAVLSTSERNPIYLEVGVYNEGDMYWWQ